MSTDQTLTRDDAVQVAVLRIIGAPSVPSDDEFLARITGPSSPTSEAVRTQQLASVGAAREALGREMRTAIGSIRSTTRQQIAVFKEQERQLRRDRKRDRDILRFLENRGKRRTVQERRHIFATVATVVCITASLVMIGYVFTAAPQPQSRLGASASQPQTSVAATPHVWLKSPAPSQQTASATPIPLGFVKATNVGTLTAIVRDSFVPAGAPVSVAVWQKQIEQASASKLIVASGNFNIFASSFVAGNFKYGAQSYLYTAIMRYSGGNPHYYLKGTNGAEVEGLVPLSPAKGKQIAAEMGIVFDPYGPCNPKATVQPVTCGTYNSILVAARYINDTASVMSLQYHRHGEYRTQAIKGFGNPAEAYTPIAELSDVTCVWHPELRDAKTQNFQCDLAAALADAWRNNALTSSPIYLGLLAKQHLAQLLAQAKAELVREHWLT